MSRKGKSKTKTKHVEAVQNLRGSGAAGTHEDRRLKRLKTRQAKKNAAMEEYRERKMHLCKAL